MPICTKCKLDKSDLKFTKDKYKKNGLTSQCTLCRSQGEAVYRHNNPDSAKVSAKKYREKYPERIKTYREDTKSESKKYRKDNKEKLYLYRKTYVVNNPDKIKEWDKISKTRNRDKINFRTQKRRKTDINFQIITSLRTRLCDAFKRVNHKKGNKTVELLGCDISQLRSYIESLFIVGMSWDNYGRGKDKWSIDHIRPCASFDLTDPQQQKLCFHYTNLQPLWSIENSSKNSFHNGVKHTTKK